MWRNLYGDAPPPEAPFPGQPGFKLPSAGKEAWVAEPVCGNMGCPRVRGGFGEAMATLNESGARGLEAMKALEALLRSQGRQTYTRRFDSSSAELKGCSGCGTVLYCGTECQKICWANPRAQPGETPFPRALTLPAACHRYRCVLVRRAREQGRL